MGLDKFLFIALVFGYVELEDLICKLSQVPQTAVTNWQDWGNTFCVFLVLCNRLDLFSQTTKMYLDKIFQVPVFLEKIIHPALLINLYPFEVATVISVVLLFGVDYFALRTLSSVDRMSFALPVVFCVNVPWLTCFAHIHRCASQQWTIAWHDK